MNINGMEPRSGRVFRENASYVNEANYLAPVPNGDEVITVTEAGIVILTPPNEGNIKALIQPSMQILTRFNDNPTNAIGRLCSAGNKVECESAEEISQCKIYATAPGTIYIEYSK